ncbi:MAG: ABC transporter permease [Candidatus Izemoplasmataceae bacterium]
MTSLIKRHLLVFLRDRWAVFFSLLAVIIIILLYALFLMEMLKMNLPEPLQGTDDADYLVNSWLFSGVLMVSTVTVPLGFLSVMINDKSERVSNDFFVAPVKRMTITLSYLIAAFIVTFVLALFNFLAGQIIIYLNVQEFLPLATFFKTLLVTALSVALFTTMLYALVSFIKSQNALGTFTSIVATLIGFANGMYVPIGVFDKTVQSILNALPFMQMTALYRKVYMEEALEKSFTGNEAALESYSAFNGVDIELFGSDLSAGILVMILVLWTVVFMALSAWRVKGFKT